jgi:hypothetical protein
MCFNYETSLFTFLVGTIFSVILMEYGNVEFMAENETTGIFFMFISLIQLMDFLFWIDIKNDYGINKIVTILGPLFNVSQPIIFYLIKCFYYKPNVFSMKNFNLPVALLNAAYLIYFIIMYKQFLSQGELTTSTKNGHLDWPWLQFASTNFYLLVLAVNIFYLFDIKYALVLFGIVYAFLGLSMKYFNYNAGELWCFFGSFVPFIMYHASFHIDEIVPF